MTDVLELLRRTDKWFLGQAPGLIHAPPAPVWLEHPGFWDAAHYLHFPVEPVFTYTLLDEDLRPLPLRLKERNWRPDRLAVVFEAEGLRVRETRTCGPSDVLSSVVEIHNTSAQSRSLTLLVWTAQPVTDATLEDTGQRENAVFIRREVAGLRDTSLPLTFALGLAGARSRNLQLSEVTANQPHFHLTPYYETLTKQGLDNATVLSGVNKAGLVYTALGRPLDLPAYEQVTVKLAAAVAPDTELALKHLDEALVSDMPALSEQSWRSFFESVPQFFCSDPYLATYYWYRWYGLRLNMLTTDIGNYSAPAVAEGVGYFRVPISYSAQCHMLETRWMHDPRVAKGSFLNFARNQREDGSLPGHIHVDYIAEQGIYHADWGQRLLDVHRVHPDLDFLEEAYPALKRYTEYFYRERDPQDSGLYDLVNQWESGQEYMSRYVWVDDEADEWKPMKRKLKGFDASLYIYRTEKALAELSTLLGKEEEIEWTQRAERTRRAILDYCWDEDLQAFVDVSPELKRSGLVFAISFYPFFTDLITEKHLPSLERHLFNPDEFWTEYPVPASPLTDPYYLYVEDGSRVRPSNYLSVRARS